MLIYDEDLYKTLYSTTTPDGRELHYGREMVMGYERWRRQEEVLRDLGIGATILIVGCGFSPLLSAFDGGRKTLGTDPSPYIQEHQETESPSPHRILPHAVPSQELEPNSEFGKFNWVIDDDVLPGLDSEAQPQDPGPTEADRFIAGCEKLGHNVVHFVSTGNEVTSLGFVLRPLEDWEAMAPHHTWFDLQALDN